MTTARISLDIRHLPGSRQTTELSQLDDSDYQRKDVRKTRVINPKSKELVVTTELAYPAERNSHRRIAVLRWPYVVVQQVRWRLYIYSSTSCFLYLWCCVSYMLW